MSSDYLCLVLFRRNFWEGNVGRVCRYERPAKALTTISWARARKTPAVGWGWFTHTAHRQMAVIGPLPTCSVYYSSQALPLSAWPQLVIQGSSLG